MIADVAFQALGYGSVLYLISVGLSVTLGLMGFINLAHGVFAMAGGYLAAVAVADWGLPWPLMLLAAPLIVGAFAAALERTLFARLYGRSELDQVLFCIGVVFIAGALIRLGFGPTLRHMPIPAGLGATVRVGSAGFYGYKLLVIGIGLAVAIAMLVGLERTRAGAVIRAAVENRGMAESVGLRTGPIFTATFALGGALGALGGVLGTDIFGLNPAYALDVLVYMQIVVAIAGLGTLRGSFLASVLIGLVQTLSAYWVPEMGTVLLFLFVFLLLLLRPRGLFGRV
ncbi:MAG: branched-chain amino acid ABC transporter permease [Acetobacteraceae bacterium]|nr:branched-chain amino acid ABC transporter permease [Acetobacteraceae bacterium]